MYVGLDNTFFPIFRMPGNNDKLDPFQKADIGKLLSCLLPPVAAVINGNTIDLVEKGPTVRLIHAAGLVNC